MLYNARSIPAGAMPHSLYNAVQSNNALPSPLTAPLHHVYAVNSISLKSLFGVSPHLATPTFLIVAVTLPSATACPPVKLFMAPSAMLNPEGAVSMASTLTVLPLYVRA